MTDPRYHSVAAIAPFLVAATVLRDRPGAPGAQALAAAAVLVVSASLAPVVGPWPRAVGATPLGGRASLPESKIEALRDALALVPDGAPVTSSNAVGAHLRPAAGLQRPRARRRGVGRGRPRRALGHVRPDSPILTSHPDVVFAFVKRLERDPGWRRLRARRRGRLPGDRAMRAAATRILWLVLCGVLPLVALWYAIGPVAFGDRQAADFHFNYYYAAEAIRAGEDFYPTDGFVVRGPDDLIIDYVYPPLIALRDRALDLRADRARGDPFSSSSSPRS